MEENFDTDLLVDLKLYRTIKNLGSGLFIEKRLVENIITKKIYLAIESTNKDLFIPSEIEKLAKSPYPSFLNPVGFSKTNFDNKDFPTVLFDYMQNGSVASLFTTMGFDLSRDTKTFIILLGTALAMRHVASNKSIHLDLTPDNIFLDDNFFPRLLYFGKSSISKEDYANSIIENNHKLPLYTAPEILAHNFFNHKADVYSFSLIAYQIITGLVPDEKLHNKSLKEFTEKVTNGYRPNISMITSQSIKDFFEWCWNEDPLERPSFYGIVEDITEYSFYKIFDVDHKEVIKYMKLFGSECNIQISIFEKNDPEMTQEEIDFLKKMTHRTEDEIWHAYEEIKYNPIDFSESSKSFDEIVTTLIGLNGRKRRTMEIYVYFNQKKMFNINDEIEKHDYSAPAFGINENDDNEEEQNQEKIDTYNESIAF